MHWELAATHGLYNYTMCTDGLSKKMGKNVSDIFKININSFFQNKLWQRRHSMKNSTHLPREVLQELAMLKK